MKRHIIEATWTGYTSNQAGIKHRESTTDRKLITALHKLRTSLTIVFTDNTALIVRIREARYREKVQEIKSYGSLIRDAVRLGGSRVMVADMQKGK